MPTFSLACLCVAATGGTAGAEILRVEISQEATGSDLKAKLSAPSAKLFIPEHKITIKRWQKTLERVLSIDPKEGVGVDREIYSTKKLSSYPSLLETGQLHVVYQVEEEIGPKGMRFSLNFHQLSAHPILKNSLHPGTHQ